MQPEEWFQLWMTLLEVVGIVGGVYLAAVLALDHEKRRTEGDALVTVRGELKRMGFAMEMLPVIENRRDVPESGDFGLPFVKEQQQNLIDGAQRIDAILPKIRAEMRVVIDDVAKSSGLLAMGAQFQSLAIEWNVASRAMSARVDQIVAVIDGAATKRSLRDWDDAPIDSYRAALARLDPGEFWQRT